MKSYKQIHSTEFINQQLCLQKEWHMHPITKLRTVSHFMMGEKRCRTCDIFYKAGSPVTVCLICHKKLAISPHYKQGPKLMSLIDQEDRQTWKMNGYMIYYSPSKGWKCGCMGYTFRQDCYHIKHIKKGLGI